MFCRRDRGHPPRVVLGEKRRWQSAVGDRPEGSKLNRDFLPDAWLAREHANSSGRSGVRDAAARQESDECSGRDSRASHRANRSPLRRRRPFGCQLRRQGVPISPRLGD